MNLPEEYENDLQNAISILKDENCSEIYLFGSLASGKYNKNSDIDFAVKGLSKRRFFHVYGILIEMLKHPFDLIGLDYDNDFSKEIINQGNLVRVY